MYRHRRLGIYRTIGKVRHWGLYVGRYRKQDISTGDIGIGDYRAIGTGSYIGDNQGPVGDKKKLT